MSLLDRLRGQPAWQHADPSVRASAVDDIDSDAQDLLAAIAAEDVDPSVRLTALSRLVDPDAIRRIAEVDTDESVRVEAFSMLREIAVDETEPEAAVAALAGLVDSRDLGEVARTARLESISRAALDRMRELCEPSTWCVTVPASDCTLNPPQYPTNWLGNSPGTGEGISTAVILPLSVYTI